MQTNIKFEKQGQVGILRFERAAKKNALTAQMYADIATVLEDCREDVKLSCLVVCGAGADFCAGNDIDDFLNGYDMAAGTPWGRFLDALITFDKPMLIAAQGRAIGIGLTWMLLCDVVVAEADLRAYAPFVSLGLTPEAASSSTLQALVGPRKAFEVFFLGKVLKAQEAQQWNIVSKISQKGRALEETLEIAQRLAALPQEATRQTMSLMRVSRMAADAYARERQGFMAALRSDETQCLLTGIRDRMNSKAK